MRTTARLVETSERTGPMASGPQGTTQWTRVATEKKDFTFTRE